MMCLGRIDIARRLPHIYFFIKKAMQESILNVELPKTPPF
jgi:hypothetical protein